MAFFCPEHPIFHLFIHLFFKSCFRQRKHRKKMFIKTCAILLDDKETLEKLARLLLDCCYSATYITNGIVRHTLLVNIYTETRGTHTHSGLYGKILSISEEVRWMTKIESKYTRKLFSNDALARANGTHSVRLRLNDSEMKTPARDAAGMHYCGARVFVFVHIQSSSKRELDSALTEEDLNANRQIQNGLCVVALDLRGNSFDCRRKHKTTNSFRKI